MNILLFDMGSYTYKDLQEALIRNGHEVVSLYYHFRDRYEDSFFEERIDLEMKRNNYDAVISINFFPLISEACHKYGIPYISWTYDSPLDNRLSDYFDMGTNFIYLFDRGEVEKCHKLGHKNVFHLPLAVNIDRLDKLIFSDAQKEYYSNEISFVGRIYESELDTLMLPADEYLRGYVEGLFQTQFRIYGSYFLEDAISDEVINKLNSCYSAIGQNKVHLNKRGLAFAIAAQITHVERSFLLNELSEHYNVNIYTATKCDLSPKVRVHGPVKYFDEMNAVFRFSKLNLCPILKCISTGIPLRALDIMGNGGVLFSNFQVELAEYFVDGEDVIMYESMEDAIEKAHFYLENENLLDSISKAGREKVKSAFDYDSRVEVMLGSI